jgi:calcineurin-like phosphoesterase family protein
MRSVPTQTVMVRTFLISDTHFGHDNICKFTRDDGSQLRPWDNLEDMEEALVENWNSVVSSSDRVYHLGDVAIPRRGLKVLAKLNGRKVLIKGNHDIFSLKDYLEYFDDIRGCHYLDRYMMSHIPIHECGMGRYKGNIHGHLHYRSVLGADGQPDLRYKCVCVEHTNYKPIDFEEVRAEMVARQESLGKL